MNRRHIIHSLVADLTPVRRLRSAGTRTSLWLGLAILSVGMGCYGLGPRLDLSQKLLDLGYLTENAALIAMAVCAASCGFRLGVPGAGPGVGLRIAPILACCAWVIVLAIRGSAGFADAAPAWTAGLPCVARIAGLALVPAAAMFVLLRRAAPAARARTGSLALVAATTLAVVGTQLVCAKDGPGHILLWHAGPVVFASLLGRLAGRAWLGHSPIDGR